MEFAKWLKDKLEERGLNPTQFADAIKENQPTIQRILSGETKNPRLKIIKKIEDYFSDKFEQDNSIVIAGVKIDSYEEHLLKSFSLLSEGHKTAVLQLANSLRLIDRPHDKVAAGKNTKVSIKVKQ